MKMKRLAVSFIVVLLLVSTSYAANTSVLANDYAAKTIQVITPPATSPIVTIAGAGNVTVSSYRVIMFDEDVTIYWGSDTTHTYDLPANTPLGISDGVTTLHINIACSMLTM